MNIDVLLVRSGGITPIPATLLRYLQCFVHSLGYDESSAAE